MKILFISHNAHRAGAQILLLNFLKWLKIRHKEVVFEVLIGGNGALLKEFEQIAKTYLIDINLFPKGKISKIRHSFRIKKTIKKVNNNYYDLYYSNTILNAELLRMLNIGAIPVICHVHEMEYWMSRACSEDINYIKEKTGFFVSASKSVGNILINSYGISKNIIFPVYVPVESKKLLSKDEKESLRKFLSLDKDTILIGACGTESFRKGKDWFIPIAAQVLESLNKENIHFIWIGGRTSKELLFDLNRCGFKNNIHFIEQLPDAHKYFNEFSIFLMLSREDPFPTVNLEAGIWETPILCFKDTGGTNELIEGGCGFAVPYANLNAMSDKIIYLLKNEKERNEVGKRVSEKIIKNYDIEIIGSKMVSLIKQQVQNSSHAKQNL